ncbi:hypothetical protein HNR67_002160 [Crossiella cryophila]|uniref:Uncharacterized protein n=1 Tax=Crossiella cryophila TaxID=43355 RepID=A0A7W7FSD0_9PSEU|nr:hypothetical protein [Crossiella cryophila]
MTTYSSAMGLTNRRSEAYCLISQSTELPGWLPPIQGRGERTEWRLGAFTLFFFVVLLAITKAA